MTAVAVLIPVLDRPHRVAPLVESLLETTERDEALAVFLVSPGDAAELTAVTEVERRLADSWGVALDLVPVVPVVVGWEPDRGDYARKINAGFRLSCGPGSPYEFALLAADDLVFRPGWLQAALAVHEATGACVVGTNDLGNPTVQRGQHATHSLVHRDYLECGTIDEDGKLLHEGYDHQYCQPAETPIWMGDLTFRSLGDIQRGDEVIGWERVPAGRFTLNALRRASVLHVSEREAPVVVLRMESGRTLRCTADHRWLNAAWSPSAAHDRRWITPRVGRQLLHVVEPTPALPAEMQWSAAWLGGMYDGEGNRDQIGQSPTANALLYERICATLDLLGFTYTRSDDRIWITGGRAAWIRFLNQTRPYRRASLEKKILKGKRFGARDRILEVHPDGVDKVYSLTTSTGNYVAWGYASKNCDTEFVATAKWRGTFAFAADSHVEHRHPFWNKQVEDDATYRKGQRASAADRALFQRRSRLWR